MEATGIYSLGLVVTGGLPVSAINPRSVRTASAMALLGELCVPPSEMDSGQVNPLREFGCAAAQIRHQRRSPGTSEEGRQHLSTARFDLPALVAVCHDERTTKAFYEGLV